MVRNDQYDQYDQSIVDARVEEFRDQVKRRLAGQMTEDQFKPQRQIVDADLPTGSQSLDLMELAMARMSAAERYKGHEQVFAAMPELRKRFPNLVYLVAGDGDDRPRLEARARDLAGEQGAGLPVALELPRGPV